MLVPRLLALLVAASFVLACGSRVGDACTTAGDCPSGTCLNDVLAPGGYCSKGCDPDLLSPCPDGSVCVRAAPGGTSAAPGTSAGARTFSTCLRDCDQPSDCRDGYECRVVQGSVRAVCIGLGM